MQRARREDDKQARRDVLLDAAATFMDSATWTRFSVGDVAEHAGLSKATVFLYYPTRESLLLGLLQRELGIWFDAFESILGQGGRWTPRRVARAVVQSFEGRRVLLRLLGQLESALEHNVSVDVARRYKLWLGERMIVIGTVLERRLEHVAPGEGVQTLLRIRAVVSGLWQMADASPVIDALLKEPALAPLRVSFERELEPTLTAMLSGVRDE
jgi:AcrR family transcriptional regulator